ncbi:hypothetical protein D3C72_2055890 [compost metagenome]
MRPTPKRAPLSPVGSVISARAAIRKGRDVLGEVTARRSPAPAAMACSRASTPILAISPSPACNAASADGVCCTRTSSTLTPSRSK